LQDYVEYMGSAARVVLVPSIRDAHHDFVFPQPPFDINVTDPHQQITCITNPGIISANKNSFYPLYPPAEDTPLDLSLAPEALQMSTVPDILIVPSDLTQFVKVLSLEGTKEGEQEMKCVCVNPGRLARGAGGGHFVELNFHGNPDSSSASVIRI
ncbi:DNA polymerase alpha subunit B, partial [Tanacetum coccineum]